MQDADIKIPDTFPGSPYIHGSDVIARLMFIDHDPRFSKYPLRDMGPHMTAQDAMENSCAYVRASADSMAIELDDFCQTIGGHIHMALVTRDEGFQWISGFEPGVSD